MSSRNDVMEVAAGASASAGPVSRKRWGRRLTEDYKECRFNPILEPAFLFMTQRSSDLHGLKLMSYSSKSVWHAFRCQCNRQRYFVDIDNCRFLRSGSRGFDVINRCRLVTSSHFSLGIGETKEVLLPCLRPSQAWGKLESGQISHGCVAWRGRSTLGRCRIQVILNGRCEKIPEKIRPLGILGLLRLYL